jgi:hypothetical protein
MGIRNQSLEVATIALLMLSLSGCSALKDGSTTIKPSQLSSYSPDLDAELGSRNNPIPLGDVVLVNDWQVEVMSVNKNAWKAVSILDEYASPPLVGEQLLLISIRATYLGNESGEPSSDLRFKIVGSQGNTFSESCGYAADTFAKNEETFMGASVLGNLCFVVDANQITGSTISIQGGYSSQERRFVSIE